MSNLVWMTLMRASIAEKQRPLRELLDKQAAPAASATLAMKPRQDQRNPLVPANALNALLASTSHPKTKTTVSLAQPASNLLAKNKYPRQHARIVCRENSPSKGQANARFALQESSPLLTRPRFVRSANPERIKTALLPATSHVVRAPPTLDMPSLE